MTDFQLQEDFSEDDLEMFTNNPRRGDNLNTVDDSGSDASSADLGGRGDLRRRGRGL